MKIEQIADVIISLGARPITTAGFETPLFISAHNVWDERYRVYTSASAAVEDGFDSDSEVGKALLAFFGQDFAPSQVVVGRRDFTAHTLVVGTVAIGDKLQVTITAKNASSKFKKDFEITTTTTDPAAEATDLAAEINGDVDLAGLITATAVGNVITLSEDTAADRITFVGDLSSNLSLVLTTLEDMDDAVVAINAAYSDWFFLTSDSKVPADILDLASFAEAEKKIYIVSLYEAGILINTTIDDTLSQLKDLQYDNTMVVVQSSLQVGEYHDCAAVGSMASLQPGSSIMHLKTLKGVTVSRFSTTEENTIRAKNGTFYVYIAGVGSVVDGKMVSGQFFDNIRGKLWLEARMQEDVFAFLKQQSDLGKKVPYTDVGVQQLVQVMNTRLNNAITVGFLASFKITPILVADVPLTDRLDRYLPDIPFTATLQSAVQTLTIRGYVSV